MQVGQCGNQLGEAFWRLTADARPTDQKQIDAATSRKKNAKPSPPQSALPALYSDFFFHATSRRARCIVVDTEPKVIRAITRTHVNDRWRFEPAHIHFEQSGRGNNWAMGYNLQTHQRNVLRSTGPNTAPLATIASSDRAKRKLLTTAPVDHTGDKRELVELVMESLRQEMEELDVYRGTVLMHSLGGGTGSGLGCRLLESIRDTYPQSYLAAVSVAPSIRSGDTPLQNYNSLFTLQHLQEHTDLVIYTENDELLRAAAYWKSLVASTGTASPREDESRTTLKEMNALAATDVAGLLFPIVGPHHRGAMIAKPFDLASIVHDCSPLPTAKFIDVRTGVLREPAFRGKRTTSNEIVPIFHAVPKSSTASDNADGFMLRLAKYTTQSFPRWTSSSRALGGVAVARYNHTSSGSTVVGTSLANSLSSSLPRFHLGNSINVKHSSYAPFSVFGGGHSMTVGLNHGHALESINHFLDRGSRQFAANAYTHWYKQYGLEDADFEHAFEHTRRIVDAYGELLRP